ncbi:MAG: hypothetical protein K9G38_00725 [Bacteroidales bacterium]|nr:hypothetical protein [Bacteroidales bacterium]
MTKISTLFYLLDDTQLTSDTTLLQNLNYQLEEEKKLSWLFDLLDTDPGEELVKNTMKRINFIR